MKTPRRLAHVGAMLAVMLVALAGCAARGEPARGDGADIDEGALFDALDQDGDGKVTAGEFGRLWEGGDAARREFQRLDTNGDGILSRDEFGNARLTIFRW